MAGKIFISYRRSDTAWAARALFERLWRTFPEQIFIDLEGISPGAEFTQVIDSHLEGCHAMLAMIGPAWLEQVKDRIEHGEEDFVRLELARALQRNIPVVPVLLDGATVPRARDLPDDLKAVTRRNAVAVIIDTFDGQVPRIEREVRLILQAAGITAPVDVPQAVPPAAPATPVQPAAQAIAGPLVPLPLPPAAAPTIIAKASPPSASHHAWMHDQGQDSHGRWADLRIDNVTQRLRWIEPGEFWMGSTAAERKRFLVDEKDKSIFDDEAPRQRVHITQGFWLADTACTQALWQTLLGENPSDFSGDLTLPVENVSWDNISQLFLPALSASLQGVQAVLPTEAQWEYACRAGTDTAYGFGELITPAQVNFNGNSPQPDRQGGEYRGRTVPVTALPMNNWGLYQMHGNVWEWCADWEGPYVGKIVKDPMGPQDGAFRVLRGGCWGNFARSCRSASRFANGPAGSISGVGFRFALRAS